MTRPTKPKKGTKRPATKQGLSAQLEGLHRTIRACSLCFLHGGNRPVPGTGKAETGGLFLIGQAPGVREPLAQKNFAWTAGKRLFQWFLTQGMTEDLIRRNAYITAVTKCYPGKAAHGKGDRKPNPQEVAHCSPYLERAMGLLSPRVVVPIGGLAIERILGPHLFSEVIGKEFEKEFPFGPAWVIPLPHPSGASPWPYLPGNKEKLNRALSLIKRRLQKQGLYQQFVP